MAVCDKTFGIMTNPDGPYAGQVVPVPSREEVPLAGAKPFDCTRSDTRHPRETKGMEYRPTVKSDNAPCCGPDCCDTDKGGSR
jgi:arsenite methyltransferase